MVCIANFQVQKILASRHTQHQTIQAINTSSPLPTEIWSKIFLQTREMRACSLVCKEWYGYHKDLFKVLAEDYSKSALIGQLISTEKLTFPLQSTDERRVQIVVRAVRTKARNLQVSSISNDISPLSLEGTIQKTFNIELIRFYGILARDNGNLPHFDRALEIRQWMHALDSVDILDQIRVISVTKEDLIVHLPPEILLLRNLVKLTLSGSRITTLPDEFNPQALEELDLRNTKITALPLKFNPPSLRWLDLENTPIKTLPLGFNPPSLETLGLYNTQITALPVGFAPPNFILIQFYHVLARSYYRQTSNLLPYFHNAQSIRTWMNNPRSATFLDQIIQVHIRAKDFITALPAEVQLLRNLRIR